MRVRCKSTHLTDQEKTELGLKPIQQMDFGRSLTIGKEYLVIGLEFDIDPHGYETGLYVSIIPEIGYLVSFRLIHFDITDPRVSSYWQVRAIEPNFVTLFPPEFYREGFWESVTDGNDDEVIEAFSKIVTLLETEFT